ncbi:MAG: hypothetical protein BAJALOKI1v1_80013 [Promethearchaeota archaeon]|nr:MAG: hypothetical protein BAJALOKI1v1_80013 [Candidatus Lokiarchaeota archaeon]
MNEKRKNERSTERAKTTKEKDTEHITETTIAIPFYNNNIQKCINPDELLAAINKNEGIKERLDSCLKDALFSH